MEVLPSVPTRMREGVSPAMAISTAEPSAVSAAAVGRTSTLTSSELYGKLAVTSLLEWQGCVFCATKLGILRFDPTSEKETWFPLSVIDDNDK